MGGIVPPSFFYFVIFRPQERQRETHDKKKILQKNDIKIDHARIILNVPAFTYIIIYIGDMMTLKMKKLYDKRTK